MSDSSNVGGAVPEVEGVSDLREIGREGDSIVYSGTDATGQQVHVVLLSDALTDDEDRSDFSAAAAALERVAEHPSILPTHRHGFNPDGRPYLVVGASQVTLADRLQAGPQGWHEVTSTGVRLAGALESAHRAGLAHGGITPRSVRLSPFGEPQLGGFLTAIGPGGQVAGNNFSHVAFQSPERLEGTGPSIPDDVYALSAVLVTLLTGAPPFVSPSDTSIIPVVKRVASEPPPDLASRGVPEQVARVLQKGMAKRPEDRFGSVEEFGRALQQGQVALGVPMTEMTVVGAPRARAAAAESAPTEAIPAATAAAAAAPVAAGPPPGGPPPGAAGGPGGPGGPPPAKKGGGGKVAAMVAGVLVLLLLLGVGIALAVAGGDDDKKDTTDTTSALDALDLDDDENKNEDEDEDEETTTTEADEDEEPVDDAAALSDAQLLAARLQPEDLPGFEVLDDNSDPIEDLDLCGVEPDLDALLGQRSVSYSNTTSKELVSNVVAQFSGDAAEQYMNDTIANTPDCEEDEGRVVGTSEADIGDQALVVQLVVNEGSPDQVHGFVVFIRQADTLTIVAHIIPSAEQEPPTDPVTRMAVKANQRLEAARAQAR